ncbi:spore germination protein [Anaerovorax odorimutans]|uniref:spore germination protein n=1 Tax=Anaerovorax odorimutans TaxID=109327 RepID=UPI00041DC7F2|nr:spore germination protein [Anaerovorax odorimutans]
MDTLVLTKNLNKNINLISANTPSNFNFKIRDLILKDNIKCNVLYINGITNKEDIEDRIIYPLLFKIDYDINTLSSKMDYISQKYISIDDIEISSDIKNISKNLKCGKSVVLIENEDKAIICNTSKSNFKSVSEAKIEESIRGEKSTFVDFIEINIGLIQEKLKNDNLKIENYILGNKNNSQAALIYMEDLIDLKVLNKIRSKLNNIKTSYLPGTGYLSQFIDKSNFSVFPQTKTTEKPDTVVSDLLQGKAAILINGCAYAIILPVVFLEFFQAYEDYSNRLLLANFDRFIRILSLILILTISPIYLVLLQYNAELVPINLIKIIIISRKDIPLPPFLEILLMEIIIEFLREGGLRLPSIIGQTLGIVGGIILGQAAIQAGMVSPTTLIVVTITVIATFVIPNYEMSLSIRFLRFYILIMAQFLGFFGIIVALFSIVVHLMNLESLGVPYLSPFAPMRQKDLKDSIIRYPLKYLARVPATFRKKKGNK